MSQRGMFNYVDTLLAELADSEDGERSMNFLKTSIIELSKTVKQKQLIIDHQAGQIQGIETLFQEYKNELIYFQIESLTWNTTLGNFTSYLIVRTS